MKKLNFLNVGCGKKFHKQWVNIDMTSYSKDVIAANLLKGIPFPDNHFDVLYHSQVLEHFPKEKAKDFIKECYRVLRADGVIRVVVPDLENIIDEYKKYLNENLNAPNELSETNYDWIMLEMFDQTVRNYKGGQMAAFLKRPKIINESYITDRIGYVGYRIRDNYASGANTMLINNLKKSFSSIVMFKEAVKHVVHKVFEKILPEAFKIGSFRLGGEVHMWMYDRYSLARLLKECGFVDISIKNPFESDIPNWSEYELDVKDGLVYDPTSLFVEARKKTP